jgi:hypothetical protein
MGELGGSRWRIGLERLLVDDNSFMRIRSCGTNPPAAKYSVLTF